jgi:integrase
MSLKIRYLVAIKSNYYWQPNKALRDLGFNVAPLGKDKIEAITKAEGFNEGVDCYRRTGELPKTITGEKLHYGSIHHVIELYFKSRNYLELREITRQGYKTYLRRIEERFGDKSISSINKTIAHKIYEQELNKYNQPRRAEDLVKVFSNLVNCAKIEGLFNHPSTKLEMENPFRDLRKKRNKPRTQMWGDKEVEQLLRNCAERNFRGVHKATTIAIWTAQRQTDILSMKWSNYDGEYITIKQSKTGKKVSIPVHKLPPLKKYLDTLCRDESNPEYIVSYWNWKTKTFESYTKDLFVKHFALTKSGIDLQFKDFRRTAITNLAAAGCTVPEIASMSGHSHTSIQKMLDTYISENSKISDQAATKLMKSYDAKNIKV